MAEDLQTKALGWDWSGVWGFLKNELKPYAGRGLLVTRMTIAATVMMLLIMTFRLPIAALGAYYTLVIARDSTHATLESAWTVLVALSFGLCDVLLGAILFSGSPLLHFVWVVVSLFAIFFLISAATKYNLATSFGFLVTATISVWDFPVKTDQALSNTLYATLAIGAGALITVVVEVVFEALYPGDPIDEGVDVRLAYVARLARDVNAAQPDVKAKLLQYADIGTGNLRRLLTLTESGEEDYARKAVLLALAGRLIDLCASLVVSEIPLTDAEQARMRRVAEMLEEIRQTKRLDYSPYEHTAPTRATAANFVQLLEATVKLFHDALQQPKLMRDYIAREDIPKTQILKRDAFTNSEHLTFALRGTAAAVLCYMAYHLFDWRGLNNSVSTCMVTALSTTGSSRQKQTLRIAGAITGGLFMAIAAEVYLLPQMNSITEFTLLFGAITMFSAWFATSSPRLSYLGLQMAFAFYIVHLRMFAPEVQLTPARDNVMGILMGLVAMWLVFDHVAPHDSVADMKESFIASIRQMVLYMRERPGSSRPQYLKHIRSFRDSINENLARVRASADAVLFEFGPQRAIALRVREEVRAWQPQVRTLFLLQITLAHMRSSETGGRLANEVERLQEKSAGVLSEMAEILEHGPDAAGTRDAETDEGRPRGETSAESVARNSLVLARGLLEQVRQCGPGEAPG